MRGMRRSEIRSILRIRVIEQALSMIGETTCSARQRVVANAAGTSPSPCDQMYCSSQSNMRCMATADAPFWQCN